MRFQLKFMSPDQLRKEVAKIRWFHKIELPHGIITPGVDNTPMKLPELQLPLDFRGKTVLDIGAWDGFFSFEAERRGASRVLALDCYCWSGSGWGTKAGFELARRALRSRVEDVEMDVFDISPDNIGTFDVVLFLGVLYHLRHPLLALERIASVASDLLVVQTQVDLLDCDRPAMAFYPGKELGNDPTNWWGPNPPAVDAMLKVAGFRRVEMLPPRRIMNARTFHAWK